MIGDCMMRRTIPARVVRPVSISLPPAVVAREITDATGARVAVPDRGARAMAAGVGWPSAPRPKEREFIVPAARALPAPGPLTGDGDTANVEVALKAHPDRILVGAQPGGGR